MNRKVFFRLLSRGFLCLLASAVLWSWIFTFLTDAPRERKIVLFADMKDFRWHDLACALEANAPEGIRFVQVHPFTWAMMDSSALEQADLYILTAAQAEEYARFLAPLPASLPPSLTALRPEDGTEGLLLCDPASGTAAAAEFLAYGEHPEERWYLFFGAASLHAAGPEAASDGKAFPVAEALMAAVSDVRLN